MKEMICILCPMGCHLNIDIENDYKVTGNSCPKGAVYGKEELIAPKRVVTSIVRVSGGIHHMVPVKTDKPIPKELVFQCMELLKDIKIQFVGPIIGSHTGDGIMCVIYMGKERSI